MPCSSGRGAACYCNSGRARAIEQLDDDGNVLAQFCSAADLARRLGIASCTVTGHLRGRTSRLRGYCYRYFDGPAVPRSSSLGQAASRAAVNRNLGASDIVERALVPGGRGGHSLTRVGASLYLFGGIGYSCADAPAATDAPATAAGGAGAAGHGRAGAISTSTTSGVSGGKAKQPKTKGLLLQNDIFRFDLPRLGWALVMCHGRPPSKRSAHSAVALGPHLIVAGGTNAHKLLADMHLLHTGTRCWSTPALHGAAPSPRMRPCLVAGHTDDSQGEFGDLLVFGGGPWQCLAVTHSASEHEGDVVRVEIGT